MTAFQFSRKSSLGALAAIVGLVAVTCGVAEKRKPEKVVKSADLGGKDRYVAHVCTDKPIYRCNETVYIRSVVLHASDHTPMAGQAPGNYQIKGPKGNVVAAGYAETRDSVTGMSWLVPGGQAGGEYKVVVTYPSLGVAPAERKFDVRTYRAPRLKTQITFFRDGYGPGDMVGATLEATRAEGAIPANARVTITARVDGEEVHRATSVVDRDGNCSAIFKLPAEIKRGEGTLAFAVRDGGVVETATKTIPILLQTVDLDFYPEGGDLVAGLPCRVYMEARTPFQKPADISGVVVDSTGMQVGTFRTEHEGRGRFVFVPRKGETYALKITEPSGIDKTFELPPVRPVGTVIQSTRDIHEPGEAVVLRVISNESGPLTLTLRKREQEIASLDIRGADKAGEEITADVTLTPPASADGVLVATVWDSRDAPLAERLIYRRPANEIRVSIKADRDRHTPGSHVNMTITTTDEKGSPTEAVVGVTVTDDSVLEMIETREQAPRLPVMALLEPEVKELADAHVYLDPDDEEAPLALDLLLGTQGWRRFAFIRVPDFLAAHGDAARRVLALSMVTRRERDFLARRRLKGAFAAVDAEMAMPDHAVIAPMAAAPMAPEEAPAPVDPAADGKADDRENKRKVRAAAKPARRPEPSVARQDAIPASEDRQGMANALEEAELAKEDRLIAGKLRASRAQPMAHVAVREYAHKIRTNRQPNDRVDFTETLCWHAGIKTDNNGQATLSFDLNDSVSSFRVFADAFTEGGALGSGSGLVESVKPFYAEPKLPLEVTMGDLVRLPIGFVNGTESRFEKVVMDIAAAKGIDVTGVAPFSAGPDSRVRRMADLSIGDIIGETDFVLSAAAGPYSDKVTRKLRVVPRGFPVEVGEGGMLKPGANLKFTIDIPKTRVVGSVTSAIAVYPTPLANLTEALERLIREPNGCFEQTSSSTYPLVMAQQYFLSHQGVDPKLIERSRKLLDKGYKRLTGYECKKKGYEWFGSDPGHEALTAYGLLEFTDMAKVYSVDPKMLDRTRTWLLGTRDGEGGFKRERRALHTWIADPDCSNGYITWALLVAGEKPESLGKEIASIKEAATRSKNSYVTALGANVAWLSGDRETARQLCGKLTNLQDKDGHVTGGTTTIVGSGGTSLQVETTALALLAWLQDDAYAGAVEQGVKWLADICKGGRYGSTQSTVLALRAILAYDAARAKPKAPGSLQLTVDGRKAGSAVAFDDKTKGAIKLTDIAELLEPGTHVIEIAMTGGSEMPCSVTVEYANEKPDSSEECKVRISVGLSSDTVEEGNVAEANVTVVNTAEDEIIPTPIAIVGIPGGLEVRHDQLKELVKAGKIAAYEVLGREVVLYWRELKAEQEVQVPISLVAAIPGTYTGPASRAYLYYTDEHKNWANPVTVKIAAK